MLDTSVRRGFDETHDMFRDQVRKFFAAALVPNLDRWEEQGVVDRQFWLECGNAGILCPSVPQAYGGLGLDFRFNAIVGEELAYAGSSAGITLQSDIVADYLIHYGSEVQKRTWLPRMVTGEIITAIAMTEPGTGSDLRSIQTTARGDGVTIVINGAKTYITNGQNADLVLLAAQHIPEKGNHGLSLILVEADREGFSRGRNLDKIGQHSADTSELFFSDVEVPVENCLGEEGKGLAYLMAQLPQERLSIAVAAQASAQRAFDEGVAFTRQRTAFGKPMMDFQNTRFVLAELAAKLQVGWTHIDWALAQHVAGQLDTAQASAAKLWHTELQGQVCDSVLQLHGGAGYMNEYPIARLWRDARVTRIYGGTNEIMKEVISRSL